MLIILTANNWFPFGSSGISRAEALLLLIVFAAFLYYVFSQLKSDPNAYAATKKPLKLTKSILLVVVGLAGLIGGGRLVVQSAVELAQQMGISEKVIGLTIVAAGTSLPELVTSIVASLRKNNDIAVGNIIGSNIFNLLFILPVSALIRPLPFNINFNTDLLILSGGTVFLFVAMFTGIRKKLDRWEAGVLLSFYVIYPIFILYNS